ncbi:MAG: hypothetical protein FWC03_00365 [Treponema sp.]|nr:hypothetical protein [Treponema sp.]
MKNIQIENVFIKNTIYLKYSGFLLLFFLTSGLSFTQQIIFNINDNIISYLKQNPAQYLTHGAYLINSPDGRVDFLKYKPVTTDIDTKYLVQGSNLFGVMQYENDTTYFLYDINGDGILDVRHDSLFIPFSVLSVSSNTDLSEKNNLSEFLNNGLAILNGNENPYSNGAFAKYIGNISSYFNNSAINRDLFYGMLEYYNFTQYPALALMIISELGIRYEKRYGSIHELILLHIAESLINLNNYVHAIIFIDDILSINPDFIPAKVYSWQLETDEIIRQRKYYELKTNHRNHWIVGQI